MKAVLDAEGSRRADRDLIDRIGIPGIALMELACKGLAEAVMRHQASAARRGVVVLCGPGNNGGDGYGLARWLHRLGVPVAVLPTTSVSTGDAAIEREAARRSGVPEVDVLGRPGLVVDALFGTGLTRPVEGRYAELLADAVASEAVVVAVDLPSGLHADTGRSTGGAVATADLTVTLGTLKQGHLTGDGPRRCGRVEVVDLGLDVTLATVHVPEPADLAPLWPRRDRGAHKRQAGHVLVVAGSTAMAGAAVLACRGALRAGAGLVTLAVPEGALVRLGGLPPEVMVRVACGGDVHDGSGLSWTGYDAVVAGPGLGGGRPLPASLTEALDLLWRSCAVPVVFDADALGAVTPVVGLPRLITPHPGEAGRLLGRTSAQVEADRFDAVRSLSAAGTVALLKGRHTLVATPERRVSVNPTGSPVLATGGSGDVLTGLLGALLAAGVQPFDAARFGAWVHGDAGERLEAMRAQGWGASDIADALPEAVDRLFAQAGAGGSPASLP